MRGMTSVTATQGRRDLFYLGRGFRMTQRTSAGGEWTVGWHDLGGYFTSVPAVVATQARPPVIVSGDGRERRSGDPVDDPAPTHRPPLGGDVGGPMSLRRTRIDVFGLGRDYAMHHKVLWGDAAPQPGPWASLGGVFTSAPAAIWFKGRLHVFGLGTDLSMFWRTWDGRAWSDGWQRIGGYFSSPPVVVARGPDQVELLARGADYTLRRRLLGPDGFAGDWQNLGGALASAPAAVSWGPDRLDVFAVGAADGGLVHRWWDGSLWNDWETVAGTSVGDKVAFTAAPAVASWGPGRLDVCAIDHDGVARHVAFADHAWSQPEPLGPHQRMRSTPLLTATGPQALELIAPGADHNLYRKTWNGSWQPSGWQQMGDRLSLPSQYRVSIDLVRADRPRSLNNDTVTGQCTLKVGNWPNAVETPTWPLAPLTQRQGDIGNTAVDTGQTNRMHYEPVTIELHETAAFNYTFVNTNQPEPAVVEALKKQGLKIGDFAVKSAVNAAASGIGLTAVQVGTLAAPITGTLLGLLAGWLVGELRAVIADNCDGVVAIEQYVRRGDELHRMVASGEPVVMAVVHPGTAAPRRCGARSRYIVTWSIRPAAE